jgi:hypothetical protein
MPSANVGQETTRSIDPPRLAGQPRGKRRAILSTLAVVCVVMLGLSQGSATTATP